MRGSGRTTAMVNEAVELAKQGERVGIYAHTMAYANSLVAMAEAKGAPKGSVIPLCPSTKRGLAPVAVFYDHYALEMEER